MVQCPTAQSQQCCSAYCRTACHNQLTATAAVDNQSLVRVLVRAVASHLLQIMKPHSFLQQAHAGVRLPAAYEHFFNHRQEHYNLKQLLCSILGTKPLPSLACEGSDSADELKQAYAEAAADEPESSAAGEARAAAAASPQLATRQQMGHLHKYYSRSEHGLCAPRRWLLSCLCKVLLRQHI